MRISYPERQNFELLPSETGCRLPKRPAYIGSEACITIRGAEGGRGVKYSLVIRYSRGGGGEGGYSMFRYSLELNILRRVWRWVQKGGKTLNGHNFVIS